MNGINDMMVSIFGSGLMQNPIFALFSVVFIGLAVGRITIWGLSLGSAAVMFVAMLYGHYGVALDDSITVFGLVLFVYCVGIGAGSRFFIMLRDSGIQLALISCLVILVGGVATAVVATWFKIDASVAAGVFAGALTSTPGLAAAQEHFSAAVDEGMVSAGYAIAYPFGVVGVVVFVQLLPKLMGWDLNKIGEEVDAASDTGDKIDHALVRVTNEKIEGRQIAGLKELSKLRCRITRKMQDGILVPIEHGHVLARGQVLWLVAREHDLQAAMEVLGERENAPVHINADMERRSVVVTNRKMSQKSLAELKTLRRFGVSIARIRRYEYELVPDANTRINVGDVLVAVGSPENLEVFAREVGHRPSTMGATDLLSLALGMALGVVVGSIEIGGFKLGMAGGPLLVSLLLGHFGKVGMIAGFVPRPTRLLLRELGLCLFLAGAGVKGGAGFMETLHDQGLGIFVVGLVATMAPMIVGYYAARKWFNFDVLRSLGSICGGMTSTPGLGVISAKTESQAPVLAYASAYPAALLLMVLGVNLLLAIMGWMG